MISDLLDTAIPWRTLIIALALFGFAPGFCLRLLVLIYPRSDPRRTELIAELYVIPRSERPFWVAEQLEVALFEGTAQRLRAETERKSRHLVLTRVIAVAAVLVSSFSGINLVDSSYDPKENSGGLVRISCADYSRAIKGAEIESWLKSGDTEDARRSLEYMISNEKPSSVYRILR